MTVWPRLRYWIHTGTWCDHKTYRYASWIDEVDAEAMDARLAPLIPSAQLKRQIDAAFPPLEGMDNGQLADLGRAKLYTCQRCGWRTFHPNGRDLRERLEFPIICAVIVGLFFGLSWLLYWLGVR